MVITSLFSLSKKNTPYPVIGQDGYAAVMGQHILPILKALCTEGYLMREDGLKLFYKVYRTTAKELRGTVVISHGFSESCMKYCEVIFYFLREGFHVVIFDHRGHGRSRKEGDAAENISKIPTHIEHFQDYVDDLDTLIREIVTAQLPGPYTLYAHSMGGCIGTLYLEQHPDIFEKAVLSSPMLEVHRGGLPKWAVKALTAAACALRKGNALLAGQHLYSPAEYFEHSASTCRERYLQYYHYQLTDPFTQNGGSSFRWAKEALHAGDLVLRPENCCRVTAEVLLFQAEQDDFVLPRGQMDLVGSIEKGTLVRVPGSKHEIYLSEDQVVENYWSVIFRFLSSGSLF